jgi:SAM-dependent methyltransferase
MSARPELQASVLILRGVMLEPWVIQALADPITKLPSTPERIGQTNGIIDARRYLRNTPGFRLWDEGQKAYEAWDQRTVEDYEREIEGVAPVYDRIRMTGRVLDIGGGHGSVRHFLPAGTEFLSVDPFIDCCNQIPPQKMRAYPCLSLRLNFIAACAEFLPVQASMFDWVHMRSMLDHVQSTDLALMEAHRVLRSNGRLVVGLYVDGGKSGRRTLDRQMKEAARAALIAVGLSRFKDHHVFHPTFEGLQKLVADTGFIVEDVYWQPQWNDTVCYLTARKNL